MTRESTFRITAAVLFAVAMAVGGYHRRKAAREGGAVSRREEPRAIFFSLRASGVVMMLLLLAWLLRPEWMRWAMMPLPHWLRWAGAALAAGGIVFVYFVFRALGSNLTDTVATRERHTLVVAGPYRYVRHPFYVFTALFAMGMLLLSALWPVALLAGATFFLLAVRTPLEEAKLIERFGDEYRAYAQRTGRFIPRMRRPPP
jgi:protein-S-isoprenylcysteine O-methyltransferase Ste14